MFLVFFSQIKYIMLKENQLSTILLLALVGFVIYQLMQPSTIKNMGAVSESTNQLPESEEESEAESVEETETAEEERIPAPEMESELVPEMMPEMESEMMPEMEAEMEESVHQFQANDEADAVAELGEAFEKPVPKTVSTDKVDFNKNLVKKYDSKDYLPQEVNNEWFETDFQQAKYKAGSDKMINTDRYIVGVNTVGQSLKNPSYDIRGTIPNPKYTVSPWNNSTYEADYNLKPLC